MMPQDIRDKSDSLTSNWLKGKDFDGAGLTLQVAKPMEKINSQYGAEEDDYLVENNILEKGQTFRYTFKDSEGRERKIDSCSTPFFIAFKQVEELGVGDWILVKRTGTTTKTRYSVEKVEHAEVSRGKTDDQPGRAKYDTAEADAATEGIPF